ncbi:MAG: hypothetical protein ACR2IE_07630 [Candidatus Sumerlaeaceae bacterium]
MLSAVYGVFTVFAVGVLLPSVATAATYHSLSFGEVVRLADVVVTGTVVKAEAQFTDPVFQFRADEVLSGTVAQGSILAIHRYQLRTAYNRGTHKVGDTMALFLSNKAPRRDIGWPAGSFAVLRGSAEGELPIIAGRVMITGAELELRDHPTTQVMFGGQPLKAHVVDAASFAPAIRMYPEVRRSLLHDLKAEHPHSAEEAVQATKRIAANGHWEAHLKASGVNKALFWSVASECQQAFRAWENAKQMPTWMAEDVQEFLAQCLRMKKP